MMNPDRGQQWEEAISPIHPLHCCQCGLEVTWIYGMGVILGLAERGKL